IIAMPMYEGQKVKKGAPLFTIDQIQQKATADSSAAEARKDLVNAERYIFLNNQGAVSTKDRDYYVTAAIQSADQARSDKATLGYKNVVAPINGTVGNINHKLGSVVRSGESIVNIVDNSRLWLRLDVPGELSYRLKLGMPVQLDVSNKPEIRVNGNVSFIAPALDKQTQTLLIKATFDNPSGVLRNNQRVSARLLFAASTSLAIPEAAVFLQAGKTFVFTAVSPAEARRMLGRPIDKQALPGSLVALQMPVELGTLENGFYPVRNGLGASDRLVLGNLAQITSGAVVASK
ncbi:efflux RND transporter periplasmic adaptor subunit, partial [Synechococcus sp.]